MFAKIRGAASCSSLQVSFEMWIERSEARSTKASVQLLPERLEKRGPQPPAVGQ
jgi:hypothetical protein